MNVSAPDWLPPGYSPLRLLGQGAMGEVWQAAGPGGEIRAVKRMKLAQGGAERLRFKREFRVLARLTHPGIVRAYDFHETEGSLAYAMEYVEGWELREYFKGGHWADGQPPLGEPRPPAAGAGRKSSPPLVSAALNKLWDITIALLETLDALHAEGIIHRDLKPANILIDSANRARLIDFGLARGEVETDLAVTGAGEVLGTPLYLSPEQIRAQPLDGRSDLYALGVILYELAAGRHPFSGLGMTALLAAHLQQTPASPASLHPAIPSGYGAFLLKLMAKLPGERFPSARSALLALQTLRMADGNDPALDATAKLLVEPVLSGVRMLHAPFIGNAPLLDEWRRALDELAAGRGGARLVTGTPGGGKSRLLGEIEALARGRGLRIWHGSGRAAGGAPGQIFQDFFAALARDLNDRPQRRKPWLGGETAILAHYFPALRPFAEPVEYLPIEGIAEQGRLMAAVYELFDRMLGEEKILLLADDLHHADPLSIKLLVHLVSSFAAPGPAVEPRPLLLLAVLQSGGAAALRVPVRLLAGENGPRILQPLDAGEISRLTAASLGLNEPPDELLALRLHGACEGNPGFLLELLRQGLEEGSLMDGAGRFALERWLSLAMTGTQKLPATIAEAVAARLARLPAADRAALRLAAVIGEEFKFAWWFALSGLAEDELLDLADRAVKAEILGEMPGERFKFFGGLTRLTLEQEVMEMKRRRLHQKITEILREGGDDLRLPRAEHAIDSGVPELAALHASPVITMFTEAGQYLDARRLIERITHRFGNDPPLPAAARVTFWKDCSIVEHRTGAFPAAIEMGRNAVALAEATGVPELRFDSLHYLMNCYLGTGDWTEVASATRVLLALADRMRDPKRSAQAMLISALPLLAGGDWAEAVNRYAQVLQLAGAEALWDIRIAALNNLGAAWELGGDPDKSRDMCEQAVQLAGAHGHHSKLAFCQSNLALRDWVEGFLETAMKRSQAALEAARKCGDQDALNFARTNLALILCELGEPGPARIQLAAALQIAQKSANLIQEIRTLRAQGHCFLAGGSEAPGDERLEASARKLGDAGHLFASLAVAARIALRRGELQRAETLAREIIEKSRDKNPIERAIARALLAGLRGDESGVRAALAAVDATKSFPAACAARLAGAEALLTAGQPAAALKILDDLEPRAGASGFLGTLRQLEMLREKARQRITG